ncbi:MAG: PLP-dependent aminotransferase family protein [Actinobacteria bacterium]|nr:PLP-dependent aminotransferase family protein [Actinomycetota bacterium]MCI0545312.1 PLP-dependent aminotransferase family protein [Actinomycetota bacterium]
MTTIQYRQVEVPEGVIDLGVGQPDASVFPAALLGRAAAACYATDASDEFLQYGADYGDGHHRVALAGFLTDAYNLAVDPELLFTTNGNSQALDLVCTMFTRHDDVVVVEEPTYFLARGILADHGLGAIGVPLDEDGMRVDLLELTLEKLASEGRPARLIYVIPAFNNPTGISLSAERRAMLADVAERHGALIVADEVYHLLDYDPPGPPPMSAWVDRGNVISMGTFSKILAPGLRLGWIHASSEILARLVSSGLVASGGGLNPVTSALVTEVIRSGDLAMNIESLRREYRRRVDVMDRALRANIPEGVTWRRPTGGYFFWLALPEGSDGESVRSTANEVGVDVRHGSLFSSHGGMRHHIRLSFAYYLDDEIVEGVARMGRALQA